MNCRLFVCIAAVLLLQLGYIQAKEKWINAVKVVESVNKNKVLPWKADTYGEKTVDAELFAKTKLGVLSQKNVTYSKVNPKELIKKAKMKPNDDGMGLSTNFTWTNPNVTTCPISHIRDQSNCGSCWAVSTVAALGDRLCIQSKGKMNETLSQEYVTACDKKNYACFGGYMYMVNNFMVNNGTITGGDYDSDDGCQQYSIRPCGFPTSAALPCSYDYSLNPKCKASKCNNDWYDYKYEPDSKVYKARNWWYISANSTHSREDCIRDEIYKRGPVTATFYVPRDFMFYKEGVYVPDQRSWYYMGSHAVRVVGWGVQNGLKYWHVANSWGTFWGEKGFFKIIRGVNALSFESGMIAFALHPLNTTTTQQ